MAHPKEEILHAWAFETLSCEEMNAISLHLDHCRECRQQVQQLSFLADELKNLPPHTGDTPENLKHETLIKALQYEKTKNLKSLTSFFKSPRGYFAIATVFLGLIAGMLLGNISKNISGSQMILMETASTTTGNTFIDLLTEGDEEI